MLRTKKRIKHKGLVVFVIFLWCFVEKALSASPVDWSGSLHKLVGSSGIRSEELGLLVGVTQNGETHIVWSLNPNKIMIPASLTKIITAAAVLKALGPSHKLETRLLSSAHVKNEILEGDLILQGGGDPGFVSETMWYLVNEFTRNKIKKISGHLVVDDTLFDAVRSDPSRQEDRVDRAYDAPVGAMSFNWNSVNIFVRPGKRIGEPAFVFSDPENHYVKVEGRVKTVEGKQTQVNVERKTPGSMTADSKFHEEVVLVSGSIGVEAPEFVSFKNVTFPDLWSGYNLINFLSQRGIFVEGRVVTGKTPEAARVLAKAESKPVWQMVADMMKFSNNFVAEMLVKNIASKKIGAPAHLAQGVEWVNGYLKDLGFKSNEVIYLNPAGLTRENRISPFRLHEMLIRLREDFSIFPEALAAFPVAGVDGTLKSRMKGSSAEGRVRAKTGLLTGVAGLAGYAGRQDGRVVSFVFLFNGKHSRHDEARRLFDQLAARLIDLK